MKSTNPALNDGIFQKEMQHSGARGAARPSDEVPNDLFGQNRTAEGTTWAPPSDGPVSGGPISTGSGDTMRLGGTLSAAGILLLILLVTGYFGWQAVTTTTIQTPTGPETTSDFPGWVILALLGGLGVAVLTIFKPKIARFTAPLYAAIQGLVVGAISHVYEAQFDGIVLQAVGLTVGVFIMMLALYATGTIKVTDKLRKGIVAATGAIMLVYLATFVLRIFGSDIPMIHGSGAVGILFSLVVVGVASFMLLLDFDFIERGVKMGAPRYMEWYGAFGLMVTLIWLYLELLRLLSKLRSN